MNYWCNNWQIVEAYSMKKDLLSLEINDTSETASGLAAVSGYEPWPERTLNSVKESIAMGVPALARLHSAAEYPTLDEETTQKLDMESHSVLIVGYDDTKQLLDVVDPWHSEWLGSFGGIEQLPYTAIYKRMVNATADKVTRVTVPEKHISIVYANGKPNIKLSIGYYRPRGYVLDQKGSKFTAFNVFLTYVLNGKEYETIRKVTGEWSIGEYANITFPLPSKASGKISLKFIVNSTLEGIRPYAYEDELNYTFEKTVNIENTNNVYHTQKYQAKRA